MEYRLYNKPYCGIFDLMGEKEPDQTKGLGLILAESQSAMKALLQMLKLSTLSRKILSYKWVVECETIASNSKDRADIIIYFYRNNTPQYVIMIEAKSINSNVPSSTIVSQLTSYSKRFPILNTFPNVLLVALSISKNLNITNVKFLTWDDLINALLQIHEPIVENYINHLTRISNKMKYYTHEVMSIPAGKTYNLIKENSIYICTIYGKHYKARAQERSLYVGCRQRGGKITELYKIKEIIQLNLSNNKGSFLYKSDEIYLQTIDKDLPARINRWCNDRRSRPIKEGANYVFVFERDFLKLPNEGIIDKGKGGNGTRNHTFPKLTAILQKSMDPSHNLLSKNDYE